MVNTMDRKTFNRKLGNVVKSAKAMRDNVQELIVAGLVHYEQHGDTGYLTDLARACKGVKSLPTQTITDYIKEHANVGWGKLKDKQLGFKKVGKEVEVRMPEVTWYDWEGGKHNQITQDYDLLSSVRSAVTKAIKKAQEGHLKEGQEEYIAKLQAALEDK